MEEISIREVNNFVTLKQALGQELTKTSQSFVRIGYLLKRARDEEEILKDSGYSDVNEFASAEFGLDRSQVSRFTRINDRFSIGGYSEHLKSEYEQYGSAKLSLMLTLPDEINEELSPEYSKSEINAIKTEYEAEQKISDMEVLMEDAEGIPDEFIAAIVKELNDEHPEPVRFYHETCEIAKKLKVEPDAADTKEAFMPDGDRTYNIRISGQGRFMVNMKDAGISVVNLRDTSQKSHISWEEFHEALKADMATRDFSIEEEKPKEKPKKVEPSKPKKAKGLTEEEKKEAEEFIAPIVKGIKAKSADAAPVQQEEKTAEVQNEEPVEQCHDNAAPTACQPAEPVDVWKDDEAGPDGFDQAAEEASPAAGPEEIKLTAFQKQIIDKLELIQGVISGMETTKENWDKVGDMLRDTIRSISSVTF